jgi:zinc transport system substrate-binding protein
MSLGVAALLVVAAAPLQVGTTLHPYFSWVSNVTAGTSVVVRNVLPGEVDVAGYQPRPEDVTQLKTLDVLFINGLGHDDVIRSMVKAAGNDRLIVINVNESTALLASQRGEGKNPHTFLSFSNAIQQTWVIARALSAQRPELASAFDANAAAYVKQLRQARAAAISALRGVPSRRVVTVHDGYGYLLQELGLELVDVVEPAHGLVPSAAELSALLTKLDAEPRKVVLTEEGFPKPLLQVLEQHGARVVVVSHIATGAFSRDRFLVETQRTIAALVAALA